MMTEDGRQGNKRQGNEDMKNYWHNDEPNVGLATEQAEEIRRGKRSLISPVKDWCARCDLARGRRTFLFRVIRSGERKRPWGRGCITLINSNERLLINTNEHADFLFLFQEDRAGKARMQERGARSATPEGGCAPRAGESDPIVPKYRTQSEFRRLAGERIALGAVSPSRGSAPSHLRETPGAPKSSGGSCQRRAQERNAGRVPQHPGGGCAPRAGGSGTQSHPIVPKANNEDLSVTKRVARNLLLWRRVLSCCARARLLPASA